MICPKCGSEAADGSQFCTKCGASLRDHAGTGAGGGGTQTGNFGGPNPQQGNFGGSNPQQGNFGGPNPQQGNFGGPGPQQGMYQGNPQPGGMPYGNPNAQMNGGMAQQAYYDPKDHTAEYDPKDISDNKVMAMLPYLLGTIGIIIALLASRESPYTYFHVRQALKITVCSALVGIITVVLCWTVIVPIAGAICAVILLVVRIIGFFQVCAGSAKEAALVGGLGFLK